MRVIFKSGRAPWGALPFWLLIAAWFCANTPQSVMYDAVVWAGNARHFSHQQALAAEVAFILAGSHAPRLLAGLKDSPVRPFAPLVTKDATIKKIPLDHFAESERRIPLLAEIFLMEWKSLPSGLISSGRLEEPPRVTLNT